MARKRFDFQQFSIEIENGKTILIECSSVSTGDHVSQRAECHFAGYCWQGYAQWYNCPWESFRYENAIEALAQKFANNDMKRTAERIREWSRKHARGEAEEAEKFVSDFKSEWEKASPGLKDAVRAGGMIETEEQAKSTLAVLKMGNFLRELENK